MFSVFVIGKREFAIDLSEIKTDEEIGVWDAIAMYDKMNGTHFFDKLEMEDWVEITEEWRGERISSDEELEDIMSEDIQYEVSSYDNDDVWKGDFFEDTYEEAVKTADRICRLEGCAKAYVKKVDRSGDEEDVATVIAPLTDCMDAEFCHHEDLRAALFGDMLLDSWSDSELEDDDGFVKWALDVLEKDDAKEFVISDSPVLFKEGEDILDVYTTHAIEYALFNVFTDEVEKYKKERDCE